jgi:hypothetical protein
VLAEGHEVVATTLKMLVTVKAYPAISKRYGEVDCVAGLRLDPEPLAWVRLYPIPFRDLPFSQRFKKYQVITLDAKTHSGDRRPETMRPDTSSLACGPVIGTEHGWSARRRYVEPLMVESMCELQRLQVLDGTSLGVFRPAEVLDFTWTVDNAEWEPERRNIIAQPSLLFPVKAGLEKVPYKFRYRYRCATRGCRTHNQTIIDWELSEGYRRWRAEYSDVLQAIRTKWLETMCAPQRDTAFFVGNQHQHPKGFMVLGVFWPTRV